MTAHTRCLCYRVWHHHIKSITKKDILMAFIDHFWGVCFTVCKTCLSSHWPLNLSLISTSGIQKRQWWSSSRATKKKVPIFPKRSGFCQEGKCISWFECSHKPAFCTTSPNSFGSFPAGFCCYAHAVRRRQRHDSETSLNGEPTPSRVLNPEWRPREQIASLPPHNERLKTTMCTAG